jgi:hypothetical protein
MVAHWAKAAWMAAATVEHLVASRIDSKGCQRAARKADSKEHMSSAVNWVVSKELSVAAPTADSKAASMEQNWAALG